MVVEVVVMMRNATLTTRRTTETSPHDNKTHDRQMQLRQSLRPVQRATSFEAYRQWLHLLVIIAICVGISSTHTYIYIYMYVYITVLNGQNPWETRVPFLGKASCNSHGM